MSYIKPTYIINGVQKQIPEYRAWCDMKSRCLNKNTKNHLYYGGRGIKICSSWINNFQKFYEDMGKRPSKNHSLDRIDNNGDYSKDNCRWATKTEQNNNQQRSLTYTLKGQKFTVSELSKRYDIDHNILGNRLNTLNWDVEKAIHQKVNYRLLDDDVRKITNLERKRGFTITASRYGLSIAAISRIQNYKLHGNVED